MQYKNLKCDNSEFDKYTYSYLKLKFILDSFNSTFQQTSVSESTVDENVFNFQFVEAFKAYNVMFFLSLINSL